MIDKDHGSVSAEDVSSSVMSVSFTQQFKPIVEETLKFITKYEKDVF